MPYVRRQTIWQSLTSASSVGCGNDRIGRRSPAFVKLQLMLMSIVEKEKCITILYTVPLNLGEPVVNIFYFVKCFNYVRTVLASYGCTYVQYNTYLDVNYESKYDREREKEKKNYKPVSIYFLKGRLSGGHTYHTVYVCTYLDSTLNPFFILHSCPPIGPYKLPNIDWKIYIGESG